MDDFQAVPATAIAVYERQARLSVAFHDLTGHLRGFLPPERMMHTTPRCVAVKAADLNRCMRCDVDFTRADLARTPGGRVQICHAGLVEWVVPEYTGARLEWVLFAGQRLPGAGLTCAIRAPGKGSAMTPQRPEPVDDEEALHLLELTRQLAARLSLWRRELQESAARSPNVERLTPAAARATAIQRFIQTRHMHGIRLRDLAEFLHISESRTAHAVREACGKSFVELLSAARMKTATELLRYTDLPVSEVAARSGFGDLSHFHATFRREKKISPHQFRKRERKSTEAQV
ncbi:MAG TPA: helix-turn-helix domain-containing protein [Planctomycetota bacterium]|nr:helix-turn-helix domain-containing protein [Planctomycetota bacterium]